MFNLIKSICKGIWNAVVAVFCAIIIIPQFIFFALTRKKGEKK